MSNSNIKLIIWTIIAVLILALTVTLFVRPSLLSGININFPSMASLTYSNSENYSIGKASVKDINSIEIEWINGQVNIVASDNNNSEVSFSEESNSVLNDENSLRWFNDNGILRIKFCKSGISLKNNVNKTLNVILPAGVEYDEIEIDTVSADISISNVSVNKLELESISGDIFTDSTTAKEADASTTSGTAEFTDFECNKLGFESVSGNITIEFANTAKPSTVEVETVSGDATIKLPEELGFTAEIDSVSGDFSSDLEIKTQSKNHFIRGSGEVRIDISTVSGDLRIEKAE